jgi:hypothetical protein
MSDEAQPPAAGRRFARFIGEYEFEILDETAVKAFRIDLAQDDDGELGLATDWGSLERMLAARLNELAVEAWSNAGPELGVKFMGASLFPRSVDESDRTYVAFEIGSDPVRNPDGSYDEE